MMVPYYRIIMYERLTERVGGIIDVPSRLEAQALAVAGIAKPNEPGEAELHDSQLRALAGLLGFRADTGRYIYHLETLVTGHDRVRA